MENEGSKDLCPVCGNKLDRCGVCPKSGIHEAILRTKRCFEEKERMIREGKRRELTKWS
jgi:hypothetical protein